jgi:hypothetical protein
MAEDNFEKIPIIDKGIKEKKDTIFYESLLLKLEKYQKKAVRNLKKKHKSAVKWLNLQGQDLSQIKKNAIKAVATGTVVASLLVTTAAPIIAMSTPNVVYENVEENLNYEQILSKINQLLDRKSNYKLTLQEERALAHLISVYTGVQSAPQIEGHRLKNVFGEIATERHMPIFPGQSLNDHLQDHNQKEAFGWTGMTAHPSAWGYFVNSKQQVSADLIENEKYYFAVQTFLIPNWSSNWQTEKEWFKFRKMLIFNPKTGQSAIGVIADSGPARYTGRQFGGSPEIMDAVGLGKNKKIGDAVLLLIDENQNQVALGPVAAPNDKLALEEGR